MGKNSLNQGEYIRERFVFFFSQFFIFLLCISVSEFSVRFSVEDVGERDGHREDVREREKVMEGEWRE